MQNDGHVDDINLMETDVLIVGAGAAGLRAAIELAREGVDVLVLGKRRHGDAHTVWAAGGINASLGNLDPDDRWEIHAADTIGEGHFVNDPRAVEILAREAPERILELRDWGCPFSLTEEGELNQRYFGAQSFRRTCFAGDTTGEAILGTLVAKAREVGVSYREDVYVTKLLKSGGRVNGAAGFDMRSGHRLLFGARAVVLAAGGYTSIYRRGSSRPDENNGDAMALAYEAGAALKDMEFVQFHPTGMIEPSEMDGRLVTEAVRGEGGRLYNRRASASWRGTRPGTWSSTRATSWRAPTTERSGPAAAPRTGRCCSTFPTATPATSRTGCRTCTSSSWGRGWT